MPLIERNDSECSGDDKPSFFQAFQESRAGPQIVILITLLALGLGSVIGVVRIILLSLRSQRYLWFILTRIFCVCEGALGDDGSICPFASRSSAACDVQFFSGK